jgi:plastocyanin
MGHRVPRARPGPDHLRGHPGARRAPRERGAAAPARALVAALAILAALWAPARAAALPGAHVSAADVIPAVEYPGLQHLHYQYGPIAIEPGQNSIELGADLPRPQVPGYITRFAPNMVYADGGAVPRVDVLHLHHGVWVVNGYPTFAAGEEKTILQLPQGFGFHTAPTDGWLLSYMIHNLTETPASVYLTYDIDFLPDGAGTLTAVKPLWMDVAGIQAYPVFDAPKGPRYTFPDDAGRAQRAKVGPAATWRAPSDVTLIAAGGHLHPGGLYNDLDVTRGGATKRIFRSVAKYFEPAGAVSWDVATTVTKPAWRIALKAGDRLSLHTTYDTKHASWYESMGIMPVFYAVGVPGTDPFTQPVDWHGELTHGHLPENDHHGGGPFGFPDARTLPAGAAIASVSIRGYVYGRGDLSATSAAGRPPVVRAGHSITFKNLDATRGTSARRSAYHTITACRAPCNRSTGIAYPLANGSVAFDSGELGYGPPGYTPAANRNTWKTPRNLAPGTYTYFCRIHPFMRGAFRVVR